MGVIRILGLHREAFIYLFREWNEKAGGVQVLAVPRG
jgi:hypothetical protein